ncbi:MAG: 50S ribosomal protein L24 [Enterobacterales bacterium]
MACKIHKDDEVIVINGKYRGKRGKVKKILCNRKIIIENINFVTKHKKPINSLNKSGKIIFKEAAIDISNVAIFNFYDQKADIVKFKIHGKKKLRFFKSNNKFIKE